MKHKPQTLNREPWTLNPKS